MLGCFAKRELGLCERKRDAALAQLLKVGLQLLRRGYVDVGDGTRIQNHVTNGLSFARNEEIQAFDEVAHVDEEQRSVESIHDESRNCASRIVISKIMEIF